MSFKEKFNNGKEKVKIFWRNHKGTICKVTLATGAIIYIGKKLYDSSIENSNEIENDNGPHTWTELENEVGADNVSCIKPAEEWPEGSLEQYYRVKEFAKTLDLQEGESYYIDDSKQFMTEDWYKGPTDGKPIVSHLIDGFGVYPEGDD